MLHPEIKLINAVLMRREFSTLEKLKISESFFILNECKEAFKFIKNYFKNVNTLGYVPNEEEFKKRFPNFQILSEVKDEVPVLCEEIRRAYMHRQFDELLGTTDELRRKDLYEALNFVHSNSALMMGQHTANNLTYDIKDCGSLLIERYKRAKENKGILGTPWPWQSLNDETMGILPKGWYVFYARPGAGKTTTVIGSAAFIFERFNKRIGVFNFEDEEEDILMLFTCYLAGIDFILCKHGKLNPADEARYETACNELAQYTNKTDKCFIVEQAQGCNMAQIKSKIEEYSLDIAIINGVYFIKNPEGGARGNKQWEDTQAVSRACKEVAKATGCAIIGVTQANRDGEVAFTDAFNQDCDGLFKLEPHTFPDRQGVKVTAIKIRGGGRLTEFYVDNYPGLSIVEREVEEPAKIFGFSSSAPKFSGKRVK